MYADAQAEGHRRDAARSAGVVAHEVRRRKAAEAECERLRALLAYWRALAKALLRTIR